MPKSLNEFIKEVREELGLFEKMWRAKHAEEPGNWPLIMLDGNEGIWWELFVDGCPHERGADLPEDAET